MRTHEEDSVVRLHHDGEREHDAPSDALAPDGERLTDVQPAVRSLRDGGVSFLDEGRIFDLLLFHLVGVGLGVAADEGMERMELKPFGGSKEGTRTRNSQGQYDAMIDDERVRTKTWKGE